MFPNDVSYEDAENSSGVTGTAPLISALGGSVETVISFTFSLIGLPKNLVWRLFRPVGLKEESTSFSREDFIGLDFGVGTLAEALEKLTGQCCGGIFLGLIMISSPDEIGVITDGLGVTNRAGLTFFSAEIVTFFGVLRCFLFCVGRFLDADWLFLLGGFDRN